MALVGQEPVLFNGTIYENIVFGTEITDHADVLEACKLANALEFIRRLPQVRDFHKKEYILSREATSPVTITIIYIITNQ